MLIIDHASGFVHLPDEGIDDREVIERILRHLGLWEQGIRVHSGIDPPGQTIIEPWLDLSACGHAQAGAQKRASSAILTLQPDFGILSAINLLLQVGLNEGMPMCNQAGKEFVKQTISRQEIQGREILEIGSCIVNTSIRPVLTSLGPASYTGVDIGPGPGVDVVCRVEDVNKRFGDERFDCVIATEVLEHIEDWQTAIHAMKRVLKTGGIMLITTRSRGFDYHGYPHDFWRFEHSDMEAIFSDFTIQHLELDPSCPGIFLKAQKPERFVENDTRRHRLYSVASRRFIDHVGIAERILVVTWFPVLMFLKKITHPLVPPVMRRWLRANILSKIPS